MYENLFKNPLHRVFVYGTLKRGEPNHNLIQDVANGYAKYLGIGKTALPYPLIIATRYNIPFLLKKPGFGHLRWKSYKYLEARESEDQFDSELYKHNLSFSVKNVFGEVYDVDTKMLKKLDELEEHPNFYERSQEDILWAPESKMKANVKFEEVSTLTKVWIYFLPKFRASLLESPMYSSYTSEGSHGLKYCENEESTVRPEDLL